MIDLSVYALADILNGEILGADVRFQGVTMDSRKVQAGNLFIALKGERVDGHDFIGQVKASGAVAAIVDHFVDIELPQIRVSDTLQALNEMGAYWHRFCDVPVIAVTGSNGKSTVKNMVAAILQADKQSYLSSRGNYNTDIGLPLMLCELNSSHQYAVLEMGMSRWGEIAHLSHLTKPRVAIITNAYPSHLEGVGHTVEGVAKAKGEIFQGLQENGCAVLNADDIYLDYWKRLLSPHQKIITFGFQKSADVFAEDVNLKTAIVDFVLCVHGEQIKVSLPFPGMHNVANALAAAAASLAIGVDVPAIKDGLESARGEARRMQFSTTPEGAQLIDDCYNANPASFEAAIDVLENSSGKKIVVLGDMKELGEAECEWHKKIGKYAKKAGVQYLLAIGDLAKSAVDSFGAGAQHFEEKQILLEALRPLLSPQVTVLVKGSRSMHLEKIVSAIMSDSSSQA